MQQSTWPRNYSLPNSYYYSRGSSPDFDDSSSYYSAPPTPPLTSSSASSASSISDDHSAVNVDVDQFFNQFDLESDEADYFAELDLSELVVNLELVVQDHAQPGLRSERDVYHTKQDLLAELGRLERVFRRMDKAGVAAADMGETLKLAREYVVKLTTTYMPYDMEPLEQGPFVPPPAPRPNLNKPLPALPREALQPPPRSAVKRPRPKTPSPPPVPPLPKAVQVLASPPRRKVARKPVVYRFEESYQPLINVC